MSLNLGINPPPPPPSAGGATAGARHYIAGESHFIQTCLIWIPAEFQVGLPYKLISYLCNANLPANPKFGEFQRILLGISFSN